MKKLKSIWLTILAGALSVAMVIGSLSFTAFAAPAPTAAQVFANVKIARRVAYGGTFDIAEAGDAVVTVTAPSGRDVTPDSVPGTVTASEVGTYTVTYEQNGESYDFGVYSYTENEYSLKVDGNGADIPTYILKGETFMLPSAKLVYYDEDGNVVEDSAEVKARFSLGGEQFKDANNQVIDPVVSDETADTYTANQSGILTVQYYAFLNGGSKLYTQDYTVRIQDTFEDTTAPTLSVSNVPRTGNINRGVTLPVATTSDNFDSNVKVDISVTFAGEPVKEVELDDNGYAVSVKETDVAFDNDRVMTFYPTEEGQYRVTYIATDDAGNQSARHEYEITVSDTSAPVINDIAEWQIPENWGLNVRKATSEDDDTAIPVDDATISFPVPEVVDNAGSEGLTISFELTDSKDNTVIEYTNILDEEETFTGSYTGEAVTFRDLKFDFNKVSSDQSATKTGTYTVEYIARDDSGNRVTRRYTISVSNTYTDTNYPSAARITDAPQYLVVGGDQETFTVPAASVADSETSRLRVEYTITSDASATENVKEEDGNKYCTDAEGNILYYIAVAVDGGEVADILSADGNDYLEFEDGRKLLLNTKLDLQVTATDSVGQARTSDVYTVAVVTPDTLPGEIEVASNLTENSEVSGNYVANSTVELAGTVTIAADEASYPYTGFELYVVDPDGNTLTSNVSVETYYDATAGNIVLRNISFTPGKAGTYKLVVRAFNLANVSSATVFNVTVEADASGGIDFSAAKIPTTGDVYETYNFQRTKVTDSATGDPADGLYVVHRVTGGRMSVMNDEFTAQNVGTYRFRDYIIESASGDEVYSDKAETYSISVTSDETPVIEALGLVPTYSDTDVEVKLPLFVALTEHANITPDVTVTDKDGENVLLTEVDENGDDINTSGQPLAGYTFTPEEDGQYTVSVTASYRGVSATALTYTINVGDVVAPDFTLSASQQTSYRLNSEFTFETITAVAGEDEDVSEFTYTKTLVDPSGEEVDTVSGTGTTYASRGNSGSTITLSKSGTYTVTYEVTDTNGNTSTQKYTITVTAQASGGNVSLTAISTVLIIVGIVLIVGVIVYLVRYRKIKPKDEKK